MKKSKFSNLCEEWMHKSIQNNHVHTCLFIAVFAAVNESFVVAIKEEKWRRDQEHHTHVTDR